MEKNLSTLYFILANPNTRPKKKVETARDYLEKLTEDIQQLFKQEHQSAEDNQDLYYDDKLNELEEEIIGGKQKSEREG